MVLAVEERKTAATTAAETMAEVDVPAVVAASNNSGSSGLLLRGSSGLLGI
ncbi:hypothetical protein A2U01_0109984, partial [Trifolium medium]|nr:hypothetical protein [Trifolium medium]